MNTDEAWDISHEYYKKALHDEDENFIFEEAMELIYSSAAEAAKDSDMFNADAVAAAYNLACHYEKIGKFDLALKYYEISAGYGTSAAYGQIGRIYYYGLAGEVDYEKAYNNILQADKLEWYFEDYIISDMYRYGYYVEKNMQKSQQIIKDLYMKIKDNNIATANIPEIMVRVLPYIDDVEEMWDAVERTVSLLLDRLKANRDYTVTKEDESTMIAIHSYLEMMNLEMPNTDLFDFLYILKVRDVSIIQFFVNNQPYSIHIEVEDDGRESIEFGGKWYRDYIAFLNKAKIGNKLLRCYYEDIRGLYFE